MTRADLERFCGQVRKALRVIDREARFPGDEECARIALGFASDVAGGELGLDTVGPTQVARLLVDQPSRAAALLAETPAEAIRRALDGEHMQVDDGAPVPPDLVGWRGPTSGDPRPGGE